MIVRSDAARKDGLGTCLDFGIQVSISTYSSLEATLDRPRIFTVNLG